MGALALGAPAQAIEPSAIQRSGMRTFEMKGTNRQA